MSIMGLPPVDRRINSKFAACLGLRASLLVAAKNKAKQIVAVGDHGLRPAIRHRQRLRFPKNPSFECFQPFSDVHTHSLDNSAACSNSETRASRSSISSALKA